MSLKTRLDGRSKNNNLFRLMDSQGNVLATVKVTDNSGSTLEITTQEGLYIDKPTGWSSREAR